MIYELALVAKGDLVENEIQNLTKIVHEVVKSSQGEILIEDDWGRMSLAQPFGDGAKKGHFVYFIYKANNECNAEITRRLNINENTQRFLIIKLGEESESGNIVKNYKTPFSKKYRGSIVENGEEGEIEEGGFEDKKKFSRRKGCWFTAKNIKADWKDPNTYNWLVNDFGKISPARVSGISTKHQRFATEAIKRARQLGVASSLSSRIAMPC